MTIKTYRTYVLKGLSIPITTEDDRSIYVSFKRGCTLGSTSTYTTSDPMVQDALESLKDFGTTYYLEKEVTIGEEKPETPKETKIVAEVQPAVEEENEVVDILDAQTFNNLVELRNALKDKGIDVSQLTNVKTAESVAKKNGYNYTVEKKA
jgi:hypothetical protein